VVIGWKLVNVSAELVSTVQSLLKTADLGALASNSEATFDHPRQLL